MNLDAGNSASYPGTGTTWTDLTGNGNNGTLVNGPTFDSSNGGSIVFDGTDDFVSISGTRTLSLFTMICWIKRNGIQDGYDGIMYDRNPGGTGMHFDNSGDYLHYSLNGSEFNWPSGLLIPNNTWCMVAYVQEPTQSVLYVNTSSAINAKSSSSTTLSGLTLGADAGGAIRHFNGNFAISMLYNRNLLTSEINQNFNAIKSRYGL
jgi:hypothetical protein